MICVFAAPLYPREERYNVLFCPSNPGNSAGIGKMTVCTPMQLPVLVATMSSLTSGKILYLASPPSFVGHIYSPSAGIGGRCIFLVYNG